MSAVNKKTIFIIFTAVIITLITGAYFISYTCPFKSIFNIYCGACGITRAMRHIFSLQIEKAFWCNQFFVCSLPLYIYLYAAYAARVFFNKNILPPKKVTYMLAVIYIALFILYGILRNFQIFYFLAPAC